MIVYVYFTEMFNMLAVLIFRTDENNFSYDVGYFELKKDHEAHIQNFFYHLFLKSFFLSSAHYQEIRVLKGGREGESHRKKHGVNH